VILEAESRPELPSQTSVIRALENESHAIAKGVLLDAKLRPKPPPETRALRALEKRKSRYRKSMLLEANSALNSRLKRAALERWKTKVIPIKRTRSDPAIGRRERR